MLFTSCTFLWLFLPLVLAAYFCLRNTRQRNFLLLAASFFFYAWGEPDYFWILILLAAINFAGALWVGAAREGLPRRLALALLIAANLALLARYKYANFLLSIVNDPLERFSLPPLPISDGHLPLGISFIVFHCLSYVIDVYRGLAVAQRRLQIVALYISFFPQLIAGPIVRYHDIADQLLSRKETAGLFAQGIRRFVIGLGKKLLIANVLARTVDAIYALPAPQLTAPVAWLGAFCYPLQVYFDFSGYSDMAIGLALLFGLRLPENFNYPLVARSMRDFWRRWHMSLTAWFRDYLYIPLGGNRGTRLRVGLNLFIVVALCGLWHGASWQFVIWGIYQGAFLAAEHTFLGSQLERLPRLLQRLYMWLVLIFSFVIFRSETIAQAFSFMKSMLGVTPTTTWYPLPLFITGQLLAVLGIAVIASCPLVPYMVRKTLKSASSGSSSLKSICALRTAWCICVLAACLTAIAAGTYNPFLYFRF